MALNPSALTAADEAELSSALADMKAQAKIPKFKRIKLVRTARVESVAWFKKYDSQDKASNDKWTLRIVVMVMLIDIWQADGKSLRACIRSLDSVTGCASDNGDADEGRAFGVDFARDGVSILILYGAGSVDRRLKDTLLRLQRACNLSALRPKSSLSDMLARLTRWQA